MKAPAGKYVYVAWVGGKKMIGTFSLGAGSALANRTFDSKVTPFQYPGSVSFDGAGNLWVSDSAGIYKYNSYPSQTPLATPRFQSSWSSGPR